MLRMKTDDSQSYLMLKNPNDTLDFVSSFAAELNKMLDVNEEKTIGSVKLLYGSSKKTSEQESKEYEGVKAFAVLKKKAIASIGTNGYFSGALDRWKYTSVDKDNKRKMFKKFDNHIKINFKCKTAKERETLKTLVTILLTFRNNRHLACDICDLDYIEDVEEIKNGLFEFNVFIYARTILHFEYDNNHEQLKEVDYIVGIKKDKEQEKEEHQEIIDDDEVEFENGF